MRLLSRLLQRVFFFVSGFYLPLSSQWLTIILSVSFIDHHQIKNTVVTPTSPPTSVQMISLTHFSHSFLQTITLLLHFRTFFFDRNPNVRFPPLYETLWNVDSNFKKRGRRRVSYFPSTRNVGPPRLFQTDSEDESFSFYFEKTIIRFRCSWRPSRRFFFLNLKT